MESPTGLARSRLTLPLKTRRTGGLAIRFASAKTITIATPVRALAKVFRGRYLAGLRRAFDRGDLHLTGGLATLAEPAALTAWLDELRQQVWVVYCKPPFAGPTEVAYE